MPDLVEFNKLRKNRAAVHVLSSGIDDHDFVYTDGAESEQYLREVLTSAADLSSSSYELQRYIRDWPSEYHLTPKRANLLRGLDLDSVSRVLELGCGCGAITRYLGEQGIAVDAVEGAPERAELAALRCAGLENINIVCANFGDLEIPTGEYDLVLYVGVTEYAGRFAPGQSDREALRELLQLARRAMSPSGIALVAIENRTGLKYVMGANEDHYGTRYVGIHGYPDEEGIRTYTRREWLQFIDGAGFGAHQFLYPFPDYKIPTVVLSEDYVDSNPWAYCHLEGIHSRDYLRVLELEHAEHIAWEAAVASGTLGEYANSFCILLANDEQDILRLSPADFAHLPGFGRKAGYCTVIRKYRGEETVRRELLLDAAERAHDSGVRHLPADQEEFIRGPLLSVQWSRSLLIYNGFDRFESLVTDYYSFLVSYKAGGNTLTIDLVPSNIVVMDDGYRVFDEEWRVDWEITPEFLLYRAVVMFVFRHRSVVRALAEDKRLYSPTDLVRYVFDLVGLSHDFETLRDYALQDERLQSSVSERYTPLDMDMPLVGTPHEFPPNLAIYWRTKDSGYDPGLVASTQAGTTTDRQVIDIRLPDGVGEIDYLRFDPSGEFGQELAGFFRLYRVEAWMVDRDGSEQSIWALSGETEVEQHARLVGMRYESRDLGPGFCIVDEDAWMEFEFIPRRRFGTASHYRVEIELRYPRSTQYLLARDRYLVSAEVLEERREEIEAILDDYHRKCSELDEIKKSKVWVQAERARVLVYVKLLPAMRRIGEQLMRPFRALRRHGVIGLPVHLAGRVSERFAPASKAELEPLPPTDYESWLGERPDSYWVLSSAVTITPLVSILVPVYDPPMEIFKKTIQSVLSQIYTHWELCLADDCSTNSEIRDYLKNLDHPQIKVVLRDRNGNISAASNSAADLATGEYITLLDHDDTLTPNALLEMVYAVQETGADFVYSDEDFINLDSQLGFPHFKPGYAPELLLSQNYITHLMFMTRDLFERAGRFRLGFEGAQDYDLCLRAVELANRVEHVAKPLYHWRMLETSTSFNPDIKPEAHNSARRAIEEALARRGEPAEVLDGNLSHYFQVRREIRGTPLVSIVIPFKDRPGLLRKCVQTILEKSSWSNFEIVGISNDTLTPSTYELMRELEQPDNRERFVQCNITFNFSKLVNFGVAAASGEHIVLMNNDIEVLTPDWIELLLEHSQRPEIGVVGAKLYFPDNTIQHAGVVAGLGGYAGHIHKNFPGYHEGYFNRLKMIQNLTAVTGALMMVRKEVYDELGGFDEKEFAVAYNDVDFCLRAWQVGYRNVFTPHCEAIHHESKSRGYEVTPVKSERFRREMKNFATRYREIIEVGDPYHNPNFNKLHDDYRYV